jgi:RNA-binding protein
MDGSLNEKRKLAARLEASVRMGKAGVTQALVREITAQLGKKGLVKVKLLGTSREETRQIAAELAERCGADVVEVRGNTVALSRKAG